ncbi:PREDICTED: LOB domain-containing protein 29-like [Fragaria vesca subsp. vesca]|uniref:LOB domain-containing protein 29-like n=1 Tax=Fragaria vesca subsp. vesca TaxID=101020 RepID=UPI0002C3253C|nr:PREDICTED: LOB domain-containing protein 29-like [Fragaria vesca subsp. vesca]
MTGSGSPCGACKFLRRRCVRGCIFAPYFCHENGATHFAAIHKVFGASNVSKLLAHLPVSDRCEAAVTISYEAQARLQDPIYGCVSHIFALQQQVVNLQAQLASIKDQAPQSFVNGSEAVANPNQNCFPDLENSSNSVPQVNSDYHINYGGTASYHENGIMSSNSIGSSNYDQNSGIRDENASYGSFEEVSPPLQSSFNMQMNNRQYWGHYDRDVDELQSMAFSYQHS